MSAEISKYTEDHEWVLVEGNVATIGVSKHAVDELGEIVYVELPAFGDEILQKDEFGTVESVKTVSSLYAPVSGTVKEVNDTLEQAPELLNDSPFDQGWMIKVELSDPIEVDDLMTHEEYSNYIETL